MPGSTSSSSTSLRETCLDLPEDTGSSLRYQSHSFLEDHPSTVRSGSVLTSQPELEQLLLGKTTKFTGKMHGERRRVKARAQRMLENGEALKYIESVLRQLRKASRDHRQLLEQRHIDVLRPLCNPSTRRHCSRPEPRSRSFRFPYERRCEDRANVAGSFLEHRSIDDSQELGEYSGLDVTAKLLTKRKSYAGSTVDVLEAAPKKICERMNATTVVHGLRYAPAYDGMVVQRKNIGWTVSGKPWTVLDKMHASTIV